MQITLISSDPHAPLLISLFPYVKCLLLQIYKFPQSSLAELARNSVIQSGFDMEVKRHWLGQHWYLPGAAGNEINRVCTTSWNSKCRAPSFRHSVVLIADHSPHSNVVFASALADKRSE